MAQFYLGEKARSAGYRLTGFDTIGSTNSEALAAAAAGDFGGHWFASLHQSAGRGRRGREWFNPSGNLAASLLIIPDAEPDQIATLGFVAGVAIASALDGILPQGVVKTESHSENFGEQVALKWPNDVLAGGSKLCGILLEACKTPSGQTAVVIGCGVNVVAAPQGVPYATASLAGLGYVRSAEDVLAALSDAWVGAFAIWDDGRGTAAVLEKWRQSAAGIGGPITVQQDGAVRRGIFETIDSTGRLIMRDDDGARITITAGDVHFGATASARS
ncbi:MULTISPECIES: biotin--[acetyl-CoA-carboxylase] ligase [unclassified Devosia]|uniref:biotin--[acetyl-CoA-carboxylase] ligase n=1 Tax=unclassified Devosia TaxID=196773 RepID=UPI00202B47BA|nr:biotin--[acetyl-CoA-carboxylase] ligase [Devosia sp. MC521]